MDPAFFGNALFFSMILAHALGFLDDLFDGGSGDGDGPTSEGARDYDPTLYGEEVLGTAGADDMVNPTPLDGIGSAWFLGGGNDSLDASYDADYVDAGSGNDTLEMRGGDDIVFAGDGDDSVDGGVGNDTIHGDAGNDSLVGNGGDDSIFGDAGDDVIEGGSGADHIDGGDGNDTLSGAYLGSTDTSSDTLIGGAGADQLWLSADDHGIGGADDDFFALDGDLTGGAIAVEDFTPGSDSIAVYYTPALDSSGAAITPTLDVQTSTDGLSGEVFLDGVHIATVTGGQSLSPSDIALIPTA
ncbi:MAG: hypothetical protein KDE03_04580 [Rhodobacteraceae bacterium]|nr:hypothetical protein [Paracoccaceae bacterium]